MHFIQLFGFDVKVGKQEEYQKWLAENEAEWASLMPEGTEYIGNFAAVYSSEKTAGQFFYAVRLDSYAAQDRLAAAMKDGPLAKLVREAVAFIDWDSNNTSNILLKSVVDATVFDPPAG